METRNRAGVVRGLLHKGLVVFVLSGCLALLANVVKVSDDRDPGTAPAYAWGEESLGGIQSGLQTISPIALANACGLGASSCFKCHNGIRAAAPNMDPAASPWHAQHKKANNSCVGCHKGNPRIMVKEMSHNGLVKSAREGKESCASCHQADYAKIESAYKSAK